jgi:hypothetical protein
MPQGAEAPAVLEVPEASEAARVPELPEMPEESVPPSMRSCSCNAHANARVPAGGRFPAIWGAAKRVARKNAQSRSVKAIAILLIAAALSGLGGCAPGPGATRKRPEIDAVLPSEGSWRLFRLGAQRHARVPADSTAWAGEAWSHAEWRAIPSPGGAFRPVQAVQGARGYFLLVDAASARLCLYDTAASLLSTFPLPERFTPFAAGRSAVFRGADGTFIFADYAAGEAWQYADREGPQGNAAWVLRARVKMPVGWRDCVQQPGSEGIACRSAAGPLLLDGALNRVAARVAFRPESRLTWDAGAGAWTLTAVAVPDSVPLFRFRPAQRAILPP